MLRNTKGPDPYASLEATVISEVGKGVGDGAGMGAGTIAA